MSLVDTDAFYCTEIEMNLVDTDATFCTEIENNENPASSQQLSGTSRYNTRRSKLTQDPVQDKLEQNIREREKEVAFIRARLKEIQAKLKQNSVGTEESQVLENELVEMSGKVPDKRTKQTIDATVLKLQAISQPKATGVSKLTSNRSGLQTNGTKRKTIHKRVLRNRNRLSLRKCSNKNRSKAPKLSSSSDSEVLVVKKNKESPRKTVDGSANLFSQSAAKPYQNILSERVSKFDEIMNRAKAVLGKDKEIRKSQQLPTQNKTFDKFPANDSESIFSGPVYQPSPQPSQQLPTQNKTFDKFPANNSESIFSGPVYQPSPQPSTSSFFSTHMPLGQHGGSFMEYDQIMETSYQPGTSLQSVGSPPFMGVRAFTPLSNYPGHESFGKTLTSFNSEVLNDTVQRLPITSRQTVNPSLSSEHQVDVHGRLFTPLHLTYLAQILNVDEFFLKICINKTYIQGLQQVHQEKIAAKAAQKEKDFQ